MGASKEQCEGYANLRAQRGPQSSPPQWCAADPGPLQILSLVRPQISGASFTSLTLHRVRGTWTLHASNSQASSPCFFAAPGTPSS